jgi:hypothetical protein
MNNDPVPKEWFDWYLAPAIDYRKVYGDAFVWTEQERQLMVLLKLKEKNKMMDYLKEK